MREHYQRLREKTHRAVRATPWWLAFVVVMLSVVTAGAAGQAIEETFSEDFEDGNADGWDGPAMSVVEQSTEGTYSLRQADGYDGDARPVSWESGPVLTLDEEFTVRATTYAAPGVGTHQTRAGLINDNDTGAMLVFSYSEGATILTDTGTNYNVSTSPSVNTAYENTWVTWELYSPGNGTLMAKVWETNSTEPTEYQMSREFNIDVNSGFGIVAGNVDDGARYIQADSVRVGGTVASDPILSMETRDLFMPGATHEYTVRERRFEGGSNRSYIVTDNATVESQNTSLLTVNEANNTLTAAENATAQEVIVRAQYNNSTTYKQIVIAEPTVENLAIQPTATWRITSVLGDSYFQALLVALFVGVPVARYTSAFGGLAGSQMMLTLGWFAGYVPWVFAALSLFVVLFIALNLAANIDYSVRR